VLKVAVVAAASELLRLAGESADGVAHLNGNGKENLTLGGAPGEPAAKRLPPVPAVAQTAGPDGGAQDGAVLHFRGALRERPHRATKTHIQTQRAENRQAHVGLLLLACRHRPLAVFLYGPWLLLRAELITEIYSGRKTEAPCAA
jgi:hypothetical protein